MERTGPTSQYPPDRWPKDFRHMLELVAKLPDPERLPAFERYYVQNYPDDPNSYDNCLRMVHCFRYFEAHLAEFAVEHWASFERESSDVSPHLVAALYRLFTGVQPEHLGRDFPVSIVIDLAEEQQRLYPEV
jgi:hypothetical protein